MHLGLAFTVLAGLVAAVPQLGIGQGIGTGGLGVGQGVTTGQFPGVGMQNQFPNQINPGLRVFQRGVGIQPNRQFVSCPQAQFQQARLQVLAANQQGVSTYSTVPIDRVGDYFACTSIGLRLVYHGMYSIPVRPGNGGPNYIWVCGQWYTFEFLWVNNNGMQTGTGNVVQTSNLQSHNLFYNKFTFGQQTPTPWNTICNGFGIGLNPALLGNPNQPIIGGNQNLNPSLGNFITPGVGIRPGVNFGRTACSAGAGNINTGINTGGLGGVGVTNTQCQNGRLRPNVQIQANIPVLANEVPLGCLGSAGVQLVRRAGQNLGVFPIYRTFGNVNGNTCQFGWRDSANNCTDRCGYIDD